MKKITGILAVLLLCLVLVLPASAAVIPYARMTMNPSDCFQPNCRFTYTIAYGCNGECPDTWEIGVDWDPKWMQFVDFGACFPNTPLTNSGHFVCEGDFDGSTSVTLAIKDINVEASHLTVRMYAMPYFGEGQIFNFERTLRQNPHSHFSPAYFVPEFPSLFLPVSIIVGFLGAVLLIQRTKEH